VVAGRTGQAPEQLFCFFCYVGSWKELDPALETNWDHCFTRQDETSEPSEVKTAYGELMAYLAGALGAVEVDAHLLGSARIPGNFDSRAAGMVSRTRPDSEVR
jgi:hypothetical protein